MMTKSIRVHRGAVIMPLALIALLLGAGHALAASHSERGTSAEEVTPLSVIQPTEMGEPLGLLVSELAMPLDAAQDEGGLLPGEGGTEVKIAGPVRRANRRRAKRRVRRATRRAVRREVRREVRRDLYY